MHLFWKDWSWIDGHSTIWRNQCNCILCCQYFSDSRYAITIIEMKGLRQGYAITLPHIYLPFSEEINKQVVTDILSFTINILVVISIMSQDFLPALEP